MTNLENEKTTESPPAVSKPRDRIVLASLIAGIAAFLFGFVPLLGFLLGAAAASLGVYLLIKNESKKTSTTAIILGGIGGLTSILATGILIGSFAALSFPSAPEQQVEPSAQAVPPTEPSSSPIPDVVSIQEVRQALVEEMENMVLVAAIEYAAEGGIVGTPTDAICSPVAGGSLGDITETTTAFECFIVTGTNSSGSNKGVFYSVTKNWDSGYVTWKLQN
jgi:hypothetical protein